MRTVTLTEAESQLSMLVDQVRHGETILILERGQPMARLMPVSAYGGSAAEGRLKRLEHQGILRRAKCAKMADLFRRPRPNPCNGASILQALLEERSLISPLDDR